MALLVPRFLAICIPASVLLAAAGVAQLARWFESCQCPGPADGALLLGLRNSFLSAASELQRGLADCHFLHSSRAFRQAMSW